MASFITSKKKQQQQQAIDNVFVYEELAFTSPRRITSTSGEVDKNNYEDNNNDNNYNEDDDDDGEFVTAIARAPFYFTNEKDDGNDNDNDNCLLNVELFGDISWPRILCFVHGVCESAETWTVQNLARICLKQKWRLAVLELEGHGLSSSLSMSSLLTSSCSSLSSSSSDSRSSSNHQDHRRNRGLLNVGKMNRYVQQVVQFCRHVTDVDHMQKLQKNDDEPSSITNTKFALSGASLGGVLAAYATQQIIDENEKEERQLREREHMNINNENNNNNNYNYYQFVGTLLLSPAVGVDPKVIPPPYIVSMLSILSWMIPSQGFLTPIEDPSHYNCPSSTKRNYKGSWPLGTSKLLLDITSQIVPNDIESGILNLVPRTRLVVKKTSLREGEGGEEQEIEITQYISHNIVIIISGDKDPIVPIKAVRDFVSTMMTKRSQENNDDSDGKGIKQLHKYDHNHKQSSQEKQAVTYNPTNIELIEVVNGDHGLLAQSITDKHNNGINVTKNETTQATIEHIISFLERCNSV